MPCLHPAPGVHLCIADPIEIRDGPTCKLLPSLKGDVVKTRCCRKITLARETRVKIQSYEWYDPDFFFYCKKNLGHCGVGKWPNS